ncbi:MaoC/PaaZ C-terminal domain-containing protein [Georgenia sp. MJ173]|uniref:MaoC/PaaZ C-terminal domain-containing protein n=1 Tax=Georgenia sunbinii TaxID=3117728 RepID=UPI002F26774D
MAISYQPLPAAPSLGSLYSRAMSRTARLMMTRGSGASALPTTGYAVSGLCGDAGQLSRYQHLLGEPGTDVLPAGYVHVLAFPLAMAVMVREDFPLPVLGMVHVANRVVQHRPVLLGEELSVRAHAADPRGHRRGTLVDLVVTVAAGDDVVWEGTSTYLSPGHRLPGTTAPEDTAESHPDAAAGSTPAAPASAVWQLGREVATQYAAVSGDRNPIHTSRVGARVLGFPQPIAHGMYTAARALAHVGRFRGDTFTWEVEFAKPVLLPGRVALSLDPAGEAVRYAGRHPKSGRVHFTGSVMPHV